MKNEKQAIIEQINSKLNLQDNYNTNNSEKTNLIVDDSTKKDYINSFEKHLNVISENFDDDVFFEIRKITDKTKTEFFKNTAIEREKIARKYALKENVFVSLNPRIEAKGTKDMVKSAYFLVLDFDKIDKTKETSITHTTIIEELKLFNLYPRLIVNTGNGYHVYFKLDKEISSEQFEFFQKGLIELVNTFITLENYQADKKVSDCSRVLRVAGTINNKDNTTKITRIVYENEQAITKLEHIAKLLSTNNSKQETEVKLIASQDKIEQFFISLRNIFKKGERQRITYLTAGVLVRLGYTAEQIISLYNQYLYELDDPKDYNQRIAAIKRTYQRYIEGKPIVGYSVLKEYGVDLSFLQPKQTSKLKIIDDEELANTQFIKREHIIENLLPEGLVLLVGSSKVGKSWWSLYKALHVASDTPLFGLFKINAKKDVIYFALEDYEERIQSRRAKLLENLTLNSYSKKIRYVFNTPKYRFQLNDEGFSLLEELAKENSLIIIDTYGRAKPKKNYKNEYDYETSILSRLQAIAFDYHTCILLVHHTRKNKSQDDVFSNILGSTALMGVADTTIVFERMRYNDLIKLYITGRDVEEQSIAISFDVKQAKFEYRGRAEDYELSELQQKILQLLRVENALNFKTICERTNKSKSTVHDALEVLIKNDLITAKVISNKTFYVLKR